MRTQLALATAISLLLLACDAPTAADPAPTPPAGEDASMGEPGDVPAAPDLAEEIVEEPPPELPLPAVWGIPVLPDMNPLPGIVEVELTAAPHVHTIYEDRDLDMLAYNGQVTGPLLQARVGDKVIVHFTNGLDETTTVHWHGVRVPNHMDGSPRVQDPVEPGETFTYEYTVHEAGSYWYHPHVRANEQVERGLYGPFVIHEAAEPNVDKDRYLMLDDILLDDSGFPPFLVSHHEKMHGRAGNILLTNGTGDEVRGDANVGQVERWRIVNTANARTMELSITGASWRVVGTDGGLLPEPYTTQRLEVAVGQRYDLEVTYGTEGTVELLSHVLTVDQSNNVVEIAIPAFLVDVHASTESATTVTWPEAPPLQEREVTAQGWIEFDVKNDPVEGVQWMMNGEVMPMEPLLSFWEGDTVQLQLFNRAMPEHPFHLHGQFFEIVRRNGVEIFDEPGLKDTVLVPGDESVHIIAYMDNPGLWMAHCHILEHAALGMMAEIEVLAIP